MNNEYSWGIDHDKFTIIVKHKDKIVLRISIQEAIESCSKKDIMAAVNVCNNTSWLTNWWKNDL